MQGPADVTGRSFDLVVIGGGINGAAIARDAALRGLSVALLEKHDWGWGTSAKSSKLAHGGLRYLELLEFALVHEALQDRERFLRQAPHLVRPLRFIYPIYPHVAARRAVRAGLLLYDIFSHGKSLPNRHYFSRAETLRLAPGLSAEGLRGGATYYDAQIEHVERLVVEMVLDARAHGAVCLNRAIVTGIRMAGSPGAQAATGVHVRVQAQDLTLEARTVINATGCWVDETLGPLATGRPTKVRKTKGAHVVVPRFTDDALIVKAASDGRTFFILPWQGQCVIGTTDTDYAGDAGDARADADDVAYLLDEAARYFPDAPLDRIAYTYAGVRALVNEDGVTESNVTRRHILYDHAARDGVTGLWSLQGGKITTARTLAEEAVDRVCRHLGRVDLARRHPTREANYPGGPAVPWEAFRAQAIRDAEARGLPPATATHLVDTYGARWQAPLAGASDAAQPIPGGGPFVLGEVDMAVREEDARSLADVMFRRTLLGLRPEGRDLAVPAVLARMATLLAWDEATKAAQLADYQREASAYAVPQVPVRIMRSSSAAPN